MDVVFQNDDQTIEISYDDIYNILMIRFQGIIDHTEYIKAYEVFISLTHKHQCKRFIYNTQRIKKVSVKSRVWYLNHVYPNIRTDQMLSAIINAENIGSQVATETMRDALIEMGYIPTELQRFETYEEAFEWLINYKN